MLVVSLFVTLIMESPLAGGPWLRSTNEAALLSFTTGLAAGRARTTKLGKYLHTLRDKNEHSIDHSILINKYILSKELYHEIIFYLCIIVQFFFRFRIW